MRKLVEFAAVRDGDVVLEIGPGTGSLTELLLERGARVIAVEIDVGLQEILRSRLGGEPNFTLIRGDALAGKHAINAEALAALAAHVPSTGASRKLAANLPYQIATPLLLEMLLAPLRLERLTCTIQREVGERLVAGADTDAYGPASVIAQSLARVEIHAHLPPTAFWPKPGVDSVMVSLIPRPAGQIDVPNVAEFVAFVRAAFLHRRKTLRRTARDLPHPDATRKALIRAGVSDSQRPETLSPDSWRALFRALWTESQECASKQTGE